jgi:hypothetical protein
LLDMRALRVRDIELIDLQGVVAPCNTKLDA